MTQIINIAAYKFVGLSDLEQRKAEVMARAQALELKGTILLTPEGINLFLAGSRIAIDDFLAWLRKDTAFADLEAKYSVSDGVPFKKLLVKIKKEIIRMNHPTIRPEAGRAPAVDAHTAARWIVEGKDDAGRPVVLLDTTQITPAAGASAPCQSSFWDDVLLALELIGAAAIGFLACNFTK